MTAQQTMAWSELRDVCIAAFKSFPPIQDEERLIDAFEKNPMAVVRAVDHVVERHASGQIRAPWRVLTMECRTSGDVVVQVGPDREKQAGRAEAHMRRAGLHLPSIAEVQDFYFGPGGILEPWANDSKLSARLVELWGELQATVRKLTDDERTRAGEWREWADENERWLMRFDPGMPAAFKAQQARLERRKVAA